MTIRHLLTSTALILTTAPAFAQEELNALLWCDHADPDFLGAFEAANDVHVNVREYEGTGAALAILEQSRPGDWDVISIDGIDVPRAHAAGILAPLDRTNLPMDSIPEAVRLLDQQEIDGELYGVTDKYGFNTISFDSARVDAAALQDMTALWSGGLDARMAVYDYYLPIIGMVALGVGIDTADISMENLPQIREALFALKDEAEQVGEVVSSQTALATGEVDILVGGGEWITAGLTADIPTLDWILPEQGGIFWSISMGIVAGTERPELAQAFVDYTLSPEGQAALATAECFWAMPANAQAGDLLSAEEKAALRWDDQADYLARSQLYPAPDAELDAALQDLWFEFLQR